MSRRGVLRWLSAVLLMTGTLVAVDVGTTLVWQEPVTALLGALRQHDLQRRYDALAVPAAAPAVLGDDAQRLAFLARRYKRTLRAGEVAARIRIPRIHVDHVVVYGTTHDDLMNGPGLYPSQPLPGAHGTSAIAGHRTTYGAPFRHVDRLRAGDEVRVDLPYGTFDYRVTHLRSVTPDSLWVLRRRSYDALVLSACDPPFSAVHRLIVFTRLVRSSLRISSTPRA